MAGSTLKKEQKTQMLIQCADLEAENSRALCLTRTSQNAGDKDLRCGSIDPNLDDYIQSFVDGVASTLQVGHLSLESPEKINQAIQVIAGLKDRITAQRRTAKALKDLIICAST